VTEDYRLGVVRVQAQAEVAVRHPAGLQDLAVGVCAELCHRLLSPCWWIITGNQMGDTIFASLQVRRLSGHTL
jgi:hypothetical protein